MKPKGEQFKWYKDEYKDIDSTTTQWNLYRGVHTTDAEKHGHVTTHLYPGLDERSHFSQYATERTSRGSEPVVTESHTVSEPVSSVFNKSEWAQLNPNLQQSLRNQPNIPRTYGQQALFMGGKVQKGALSVDYAEFTEPGSKRFGEAMGMIKNLADETNSEIIADTDLSPHSGPLVNRLLDQGLITTGEGPDWRYDGRGNGMSFRYPEEVRPYEQEGIPIKDEVVDAGRKTVRKIASDMNKQRRAKKPQTQRYDHRQMQLPGMEDPFQGIF